MEKLQPLLIFAHTNVLFSRTEVYLRGGFVSIYLVAFIELCCKLYSVGLELNLRFVDEMKCYKLLLVMS